jgi:hypothetical protein
MCTVSGPSLLGVALATGGNASTVPSKLDRKIR